ncbi:MAG: hypothetical protein QOE26_2759 [Verrucomicrobiota bacterium]|jgi:hypothetical protein
MADSITWLVNADASQIRAEMNSAMQSANRSTDAMVQGFNRADLAHGTLLKSNARVSHQIGLFARTAASGADSLTLMATGMEAVAHATRLPLGPLTALIVAGTLAFKLHESSKEWTELNKQQDEFLRKDLTKEKTDQLEKLKTQAEELRKKMDEHESSFWHIASQTAGRLVQDSDMSNFRVNPHAPSPKEMADKAAAPGDQGWLKARDAILKGQRDAAEAYHKQRLADIPKEVDAEIAKRKHDEEVGKDAASFKDKLQLSLAEIAKDGLHKRTSASFDNTKQYAGDVAEHALKEEGLARKSMLKGNYGEAIQHQSVAEQLKATIPSLKDSEKIATFRSALDTSERLKEIAKNISFKGQ